MMKDSLEIGLAQAARGEVEEVTFQKPSAENFDWLPKNPAVLGMIGAFTRTGFKVYEGTVTEKVALRRLAARKAQKRARRANRGR